MKGKLNSCMCCQMPHRGLESLQLCCPGATPLTAPGHSQEEAEDTRGHPAVRFVSTAVPCLSWVRSSSSLGSTTDPCGHQDKPHPLCMLPCLQQPQNADTCCCQVPDVQLCVAKSAQWRRAMLKISNLCFTISVHSWVVQEPRSLWHWAMHKSLFFHPSHASPTNH